MTDHPTPQTDDPARRWPRATSAGLTLRPAAPGDEPFLFDLYAATRIDELGWLQWTERQKSAFISIQARAQDAEFGRNFPDAERLIVEENNRPVGRLYLQQRKSALHIVEMSLMPHAQRRGVGTAIVSDLIGAAAAAARDVTTQVEKANPAMSLYRRMGFVRIEDRGVYELLRRSAGTPPSDDV